MSGEDYSITVESVEYVHGYARSGGNDVAEIYGSDADELYVGRTGWSRLSGDGYALRAKFFDSVVVNGGRRQRFGSDSTIRRGGRPSVDGSRIGDSVGRGLFELGRGLSLR